MFGQVAALLVAIVFAVSGIAKLKDPSAAQAGFDSLRVPPLLAQRWIVKSLPWGELVLAVGILMPGYVGSLASVAAVGLCIAYWVLIARALKAGKPADCNCFGDLGQGDVTKWTLVRNSLLLLIAGLALVQPIDRGSALVDLAGAGTEVWAWLGMMIVTAVLAVLIVWQPQSRVAVESMADSQGDSAADEDLDYQRLPIPFAWAETETGERVTLRALASERPVLLIFISVSCGPCRTVLSQVPEWISALPVVDVRLIVASLEDLRTSYPDLASHGLQDTDRQLAELFGRLPTPSAVLLGADGLLAGGPVLGNIEVESLVEQMREQLSDFSEVNLEETEADLEDTEPAHA